MDHIKGIVIVGGGYVGSISSLLCYSNPNLNVSIIEKDNKLCGLYNNAWEKDNCHFSFDLELL